MATPIYTACQRFPAILYFVLKLCKRFLERKVVVLSVMKWPAKSANLNPTELLWE